MKSIFTFVAFLLFCSLLLSTFEEAQGIGFITELIRPTRSSKSSKRSMKRNKVQKGKRYNRQLKHQIKRVVRSLKKAQHREAILQRMLHTVSYSFLCKSFKIIYLSTTRYEFLLYEKFTHCY